MVPILTPKGPNIHTTDKPILGIVTWSQFLFLFFETFCEDALHNKLHGSTNFIFFRPTNQKLWMFEVFWRSLGRAGMCSSQWGRVDHICKNLGVGGRKEGIGGIQQRGTRVGAVVSNWPHPDQWLPTFDCPRPGDRWSSGTPVNNSLRRAMTSGHPLPTDRHLFVQGTAFFKVFLGSLFFF
jgi:hypothetical protein